MQIAICDDDPRDAAYTKSLVDAYCLARPGLALESVFFSDGASFLSAVNAGADFAVCLLDILMPGLTGIELADRLSELRVKAPVIFLTVSPEYALDAFRVRARQYLIKPVTCEALFSALDYVLSGVLPARSVMIASEEGETAVRLDRVTYAECCVHRVRYHLADGRELTSRTLRVPFLEAVRPLVECGRFLLPHRSYVVNADFILRLNGSSLCLLDGTVIPVSQLRMAEFRRSYMALMTG